MHPAELERSLSPLASSGRSILRAGRRCATRPKPWEEDRSGQLRALEKQPEATLTRPRAASHQGPGSIHSVLHQTGDTSRRPQSGEGSTTPGLRFIRWQAGRGGGGRQTPPKPFLENPKSAKPGWTPFLGVPRMNPQHFLPQGKQVGQNSRHPSGVSQPSS